MSILSLSTLPNSRAPSWYPATKSFICPLGWKRKRERVRRELLPRAVPCGCLRCSSLCRFLIRSSSLEEWTPGRSPYPDWTLCWHNTQGYGKKKNCHFEERSFIQFTRSHVTYLYLWVKELHRHKKVKSWPCLLVNIDENEHDVLVNRAHVPLYWNNVIDTPTYDENWNK